MTADNWGELALGAFQCFVNALASEADSLGNLGQSATSRAQLNHQSKLTWVSSSSLCHRRYGLSGRGHVGPTGRPSG